MRPEIIILTIYGVSFLALGLWVSRGVRTAGEFLVAGRQLGLWVLVGTLSMTELNTMSLVGFSGYGYRAGIYATMIPLMFVITFLFYMVVYAKRWKRFDGTSTSEFFEARYGSPAMARVVSLLWLVGLLLIVPNYMTGAAVILKLAFGLSFEWSVILICGMVFIFTVIGGLKAVAYTDYASMLLAFVAFPALLIYAIKNGGGWNHLFATFSNIKPEYNHWNGLNMIGDQVLDFRMLIGWMCACFWVFQMAQWYGQKIFAAKDERTAYWAMGITSVVVYLAYASVILVAAFVRAVNPNIVDVEKEPPVAWAIMNLVHHPIWRGIILANIFAVCQTTVSSVWNGMVASITQDLYKGWYRPGATDRELLKASRWITVLLTGWTVFGAIFIIQRFTGIVRGTAIANAFMFIPTIPCLLGFLWRRYHRRAAWATMVVAGVLSISIVAYLGIYLSKPFFFEVFVVTAIITLLSGIAFGWSGKADAREVATREKLYQRVGDPYFRSGSSPVYKEASGALLSPALADKGVIS
jgi:Na+/proline symporter